MIIRSKIALDDPLWRAIQGRAEAFVPFRVSGLPRAIQDNWAIACDAPAVHIFPDKLAHLKKTVVANPFKDEHSISVEGIEFQSKIDRREEIFRIRNGEIRANNKQKVDEALANTSGLKASVSAKSNRGPANIEDPDALQDAVVVPDDDEWLIDQLRSSCLKDVTIEHTVSAKLDFTLHEVFRDRLRQTEFNRSTDPTLSR